MTECKNHNVPDFDEKYESARALFDETVWILEHSRESIPDVRENLRECVASLRSMYPEEVESIEGLPMPSDVQSFHYSRLEALMVDLRERYFPNMVEEPSAVARLDR
jgi:hypothetical protein